MSVASDPVGASAGGDPASVAAGDRARLAFEPLVSEPRRDPYPLYRRLRDESPVYWAPQSKAFVVSRHDDVVQVLKHPELFSSEANRSVLMGADPPLTLRVIANVVRFLWKAGATPWRMRRATSLIATDPPRHEAIRGIVKRGFTPRKIAAWEPRIGELVDGLMAEARAGAPFDVVEGLAIPLPTTIIAEMLGVEPERRDEFKRWSDAIIDIASGSARGTVFDRETVDCLGALFAYLRETVRARRARPGDDLVSVLVDPSHGVALDELDVVQFVLLLLVAGNETTTNLIGNAANALLEHPAELDRVARSPQLVPALVEETLRFDAPVQILLRDARVDTEIAGVPIPEGSVVVPLVGSANRDERRWPEADAFRVGRDPRGHLGFGLGIHFCLGAALARLEARVALEALVPELARRSRAPGPVELVDSFIVRGRRSLLLEAA
jgi:cytochrome P450